MTDPSHEEATRHLLYQLAHHDTWWAKTQTWQVTSWALLLFGASVTVSTTLEIHRSQSSAAAMSVMNLLIGVLAASYLARLHDDTVRARYTTEKVAEGTAIERLGRDLAAPGTSTAPAWRRGSAFVGFLIAVVGTGAFFASWYQANDVGNGLLIGLLTFLWGEVCLVLRMVQAKAWNWPTHAT
jgi:hypothetical protein